ncbi:MAG: tetratricopeptide repeat protein [Marinicellaceae bacterium]
MESSKNLPKTPNQGMNKEDYQLIKATLISVDGLPLSEQISQVKVKCKDHPHLLDSIIEMLKSEAQDIEREEDGYSLQDIFTNPPILEHVLVDAPEKILVPGTQINQYSIVDKIGIGGMGVVYSAKQKFPAERLVALKLISHLPNQEQLIKETNTLAQLNHPNIATLFEIDKNDAGQLYIAMELIEGQDIVHWCKTHNYSDKQRIKLFQQLCSGITYAHEKGIIHCDIKPSNVLVTHKNNTATVKIIDFGISQHQDHKVKRDEISGTPAYLAPEVLNDKQHVLADTRRDVYAMGALLDKLLSKNRGYDLQAIINKATATDRENRYSTSEKLSRDLSRYFSKKPLSARVHNWWYLSVLFLKRRFVLVTVSLAFVGLLIGGYFVQAKQAQAALIAQAEAEEVSTFLTDLFDVANPERSNDKITSSYDLLNKAKDKLLAIENPNLSDARFMHTIGTIYTRMDKLEDAQIVIEKSLRIKKSSLAENNMDLIAGTIQLGLLYKNLNLYEKSEQQLQTAINTMQKYENSDLSQLAYAHNHLGNLYKQNHVYEKAITQHIAAIKIREELGDKKLLADSYNNLGVTYLVKRNFKESSQYLHKALDLYETEYDEFHPFLGITKTNLASILEVTTNDFVQAEKYLLEAFDIFKKAYGTDHYNTVTLQPDILSFYNRRMQFDKGIEFYNENIEAMMASNRFDKIVVFKRKTGWAYAKSKQFDSAAQMYLEAIEIATANQISHQDLQEKLYIGYYQSLVAQQKYSLAREQLEKALKYSKARAPEIVAYQLNIQNHMADLDFEQGQFEAAKSTYLKIIAHTETGRLFDREYIDSYIGLSKIYSLEKDHVKNQNILSKARELAVSTNHEGHFLMGQIDYQQGLLYLSQDQTDLAKMALEKAYVLQSKIRSENHPELLATTQALKSLN